MIETGFSRRAVGEVQRLKAAHALPTAGIAEAMP
jgi:hypothetical protein